MHDRTWHLLKASDQEIFGPTDLETLRGWASEAKISPLDKISSDNRMSWQRAPMIAELQMDMLVQMPDNYLYGPTNVATIQEFLATGEIDENVHAQNTFQFAAALQKAGKRFDLMVYPGNRHGIVEPAQRRHLYTMMAEYVHEHL